MGKSRPKISVTVGFMINHESPGVNCSQEIYCPPKFPRLQCSTRIITDDGSSKSGLSCRWCSGKRSHAQPNCGGTSFQQQQQNFSPSLVLMMDRISQYCCCRSSLCKHRGNFKIHLINLSCWELLTHTHLPIWAEVAACMSCQNTVCTAPPPFKVLCVRWRWHYCACSND